MQFVQALNEQIETDLDKAIPYESCIHILAMEKFLEVYDKKFGIDAEDFFMESKKEIPTMQAVAYDHSYNEMQPREDLFRAVCGGVHWIAVKPVDGHWGVCTFVYSKVTPPRPELKCRSCSLYHCIHVSTLARAMEVIQEDDDSPLALFKMSVEISPEMRDYFEMATRSEEKVQLFATGNENDANDFSGLPQRNGVKFLVPSTSGCCPCGAEWNQRFVDDEWLDVEHCVVAYLYTIHEVNVYYRPCSSCQNKKRYDGFENRVVWFGSFCISHAVLKDYIRLFITSSLPMYKYYVAFVQRQVSSGNFVFQKLVTYTKFRLAVIAMIRLLDIKYEDGFFCDTCGKIPKKVVMDGTTLGIQKTYLPNNLAQSDTGLLDGSRFEMRNFINRKSVRDLLKKFVQSGTSAEEFEELKSEIPSPGLKALLDSLEEQGFTGNCPQSCRRLLTALASDKPVCAIVPPCEEVLDLLTQIGDGVNPKDNPTTDLKLLHEQLPILFNILEICGEIPPSIRLLVKELGLKSISPFVYGNGQQRIPHNLPSTTEHNFSSGYLPCLPQLVQRGNYTLDSRKAQKGDCAKVARAKKKHGTLIPGIFCILCPHGICYGFEIMRDHESPDIPFTILRTRFPEDERNRNEHTLMNISKTHERMKSEVKVSSYFKSKLKGLYGAAIADCEAEAELIRRATDKIANIQALTNEGGQGRSHADGSGLDIEPSRKAGMRRGVLMTILQQNAAQLPMFMGKASENVPPLCGSIPPAPNYTPDPGDHVAARVRTPDGEEQWILAEVVSFNPSTNKYDIDDIDEEGGNKKERHHLSRRRFIPLPKMKVNPLTHKHALFQKQELVLALYPQTTCFYRALIHEPPSRPQDDYSVLFEDTSYPEGYSPPLCVAQRYVVTSKENKRR